jgi:small subunit ribosomal protein S13
MVRIAGINIPDNKRIEVALTYVYGIGLSTSQKILKELSIDPDTRTKDLVNEDANRLRDMIEKKYRVEGELRHVVKQNIKRLKEIGCFEGLVIRRVSQYVVSGPRPILVRCVVIPERQWVAVARSLMPRPKRNEVDPNRF